jgi:hypothetical protein
MNIRYPAFAPVLGIMMLSACASLSPTAMVKLAGTDPLTVDPEKLSVAAVMPVPLKLRTGDVVLSFVLDAPAPYGPVNETIPLEIIAGERTAGVPASPSFERVQIARVAQADVARLAAAQAKARAFRETGRKDGKGSISVTITGGCRDGRIGDAAMVASIFMRSAPDEKYFPLVSSVNLRKLVGEAAVQNIPLCDGVKS